MTTDFVISVAMQERLGHLKQNEFEHLTDFNGRPVEVGRVSGFKGIGGWYFGGYGRDGKSVSVEFMKDGSVSHFALNEQGQADALELQKHIEALFDPQEGAE